VSYIVLRGRWCNIIVWNVQAPSEKKSDDSKDIFYEELEQVSDHFPTYHMTIPLGYFNAKVGTENIFKPKLGMGVYIRMVKIMVLERQTSPRQKIWLLRARCSCTETFISTFGPLLMGRLTTRLITY